MQKGKLHPHKCLKMPIFLQKIDTIQKKFMGNSGKSGNLNLNNQ